MPHVVVQVRTRPQADILALNRRVEVFDQHCVRPGLIRRVGDLAQPAPECSFHEAILTVNRVQLCPLLEFDDDNRSASFGVQTGNHEIHSFGCEGHVVFDRHAGIVRDSGVIHHDAHP